MRGRVYAGVMSALLILVTAACIPGGLDEGALATEVAATIYAEQTAGALSGTSAPQTPATAGTSSGLRTGTPKATQILAPTNTPRPTFTPSPTLTPTPSGPPLAKEQVLHLATTILDTIDPVQAPMAGAGQIVYELFVGLTRQDEETAEVQPALARSWEVSDDGLRWTFHLREDVPWVHYENGEVRTVTDQGKVQYVTAQDFGYGLKRLLDPDEQAYFADVLYAIEGAQAFYEGTGDEDEVGIRALDAQTLEIRLTKPTSHLDAVMSMPWAVAVPERQITAAGEGWTEVGRIQSYGPYALQDWVPDSYAVLVANPYWPETDAIPQPTIQEITWGVMEAEQAMAAFRAGELDTVEVLGDAFEQSLGDPTLVLKPRPCTYALAFNTTKPPFDDPRVRLAFSLAVDREALVAEVLQGLHEPARWFSRPGLRAFPSEKVFAGLGVSFAPDDARALLDEVYPDPSQLDPVVLAFPDAASHGEIASSVGEMWAGVLGAQVELEPMPWGEYLDALTNDPPQIWRLGWCASDYMDAYDFLGSTFGSDGYLTERTRWSSQGFGALVEQAASTLDPDARAALYAQAEDLLVRQEAVVIPIYWQRAGIVTRPQVQRTFSMVDGAEHLEKWMILASNAPTPTPQPTQTRRPTSTPRPTFTPSPTPCLPDAEFVSDVSVPDGTQFQPGAKFTKTWSFRSSGCAPWPEGMQLVFSSGEQLGAAGSVPVPTTALGATVDISVAMVAPGSAGTYKGHWELQAPDGTRFGDKAYVEIVVVAPTPTPGTCPGNPALVEVINQLSVNLTIDLQGPQTSSIWVAANSTKRYCAVPGTYSFTAKASGFNPLTGEKTLSSGACQCWWFYAGIKVSPLCNCDNDASHYVPLP